MRRILFSVAVLLASLAVTAQTAQFTMKAVSSNKVNLFFLPSANIGPLTTGISTLTFVLQIPNTYPDPQMSWVVVPNSTWIGPVSPGATVNSTSDGGKHNTLFSAPANPTYNGTFLPGTEYLLATITLPAGVSLTELILKDWANNRVDGSGPPLYATSIAFDGTDRTNNAAIFYSNQGSNPPVNAGSAAGSSSLTLNGGLLPLTLLEFNVTNQGGAALLQWSTSTERNTREFVIERSSDSRSWTYAGTVAAVGNSTVATQYRFTDAGAVAGPNYYRLRMLDKDGKEQVSPVRLLILNGRKGTVQLYPNPVFAGQAAWLYSSLDETVKYRVIDVAGRTLATGSFRGQVVLRQLPAGLYTVTLESNGFSKTERLLVQ